jgi:hypothetical protein
MRILIWSITIIVAVTLPSLALAQNFLEPIVPQCAPYCQMCDLVKMGDNIIRFLISIFAVIAAILLTYAGFLMVTAGGNTSQVSKGKGILLNTVIGLVIMLVAWLAVDTIMKMLAGGQAYGMWRQIECVYDPSRNYTSGATLVEPITFVNASGQTVSESIVYGTEGCPTCVNIDASVASCKSSSSCTVSAEYYERLKQLGGGLEITEGYPPTRNHQNKCHTTGDCVDIVFADRNWNTQRVNAFIAEAQAAGLRAVYEPASGSCAGYTNCQPPSVTGATGNHFSLYMLGNN